MHRILFVIGGMGSGGAERVMSLLVNQSVQAGNETALVLVTQDDYVVYPIDDRVQRYSLCEDLPQNRLQAAAARFTRLRRIIKTFRPNAVVSFTTTCNIYTCLAAVGLGVPVIISERNDPVRDCPSKLRRLARNAAYCLADGFIFQTDEARDHFAPKIRRAGTVIPNPVKDGLPYAELSDREKTVVAASRLTKQKNYPMLLAAFAKFRQTHPDYRLQIFGEGELETVLKERVAAMGLSDSVEFMGVATDLHDRIKRAGMFVLSSDYEGISNSLLEALSMGLPCISTDCPCGGSRHLIEDGVNGLLTPVGDAEAFARAMRRIADSEELAQSLGSNARQTRQSHSTETILKQYFDYISRISGRA